MKKDWISDIFSNCIKLKSGDGLTAKKMIPGEIAVYGGNGIAGYHSESNLNGSQIIIGRVGALCGRVRHLNEEIWLTDNAFKISEYKYDFDPKFLTYLLNHLDLRSFARQAAQPVISNSSLKDVLLTFPESVPEQKAIVKILDEAFAKIDQAKANIEKNIENAKELFQSKLNEIFSKRGEGWEEEILDNLGEIRSSKRIFKKEYVESGIPYYRSKEIKELAHGKSISTNIFIEEEKYFKIKAKYGVPKIGDIMLTAIGATIGEIYVVNTNNKFYFKDGNVLWLKDFKNLNPYFLKYSLQFYLSHILSIVRGAAYNALTMVKLKQYTIAFPDIRQQEKIVESLDRTRILSLKCESQYQLKLEQLEDLKKSLLQKAFSGELTKMSEPMIIND